MRTLEVKFKVIRNGADYKELYPLPNSTPIIRMDESAAIKTSLSADFVYDSTVDWLTDQIQPVLIIDGVESSLGYFLPATVTPEENATTKSVSVEAYDRCWLVRDVYSTASVYFAAGTNYITAINSLLTACNVALVVSTPTTKTFAEAREDWQIGTSYLTIINELLSEISYNPLWFNAQGAAVLEPASVPSAENIEHVLDDTVVSSLLLPEIAQKTDIYSAPNVFVCICSNASKDAPLVATAENTNPQSPLSIMRRGRRIVSIERVNNVTDLTALQDYADNKRNQSMIGGETISVVTGLHDGYGVNDVTAIHYGDLNAICVERGWQMELKVGGNMKHTLERVVIDLG